jgi:hypothetical protein
MMTLAKVEPMPVPIQTFCYSVLKELGAPDLTLVPLNLDQNLFVQYGHHRYYLDYVIVQKENIKDGLLGDWERLRKVAVGFVGWRSDTNLIFALRSPIQSEIIVTLHHHRQQEWARQTLITTLKGVLAALRVEAQFGVPYCVVFQDRSRGGLFGRVTAKVDLERLRKGVGLVLSRLDSGEVVVTAMAGRKILGHLDPDTVLKDNWDAVKQWVGSVVLDGILLLK